MAQVHEYGTGMGTTPVDIASGALTFGIAAANEKLRQIEEDKQEVSENYKNVLKAQSLQLLPELMSEQRYRYEEELDKYKQSVRDMFKESGGKLTGKQNLDIQNGFLKLQTDMKASVLEGQELTRWAMKTHDPNFHINYNAEEYKKGLGEMAKKVIEGKPHENMSSFFTKFTSPLTAGDFIDKKFGRDIDTLDVESLGNLEGNIFETIEKKGLAVGDENSYKKAVRMRDQILNSPYFKEKYTDTDGTTDQMRYEEQRQIVEDNITQTIRKQQKGYAPKSSGSTSSSAFYSTPEPFTYKYYMEGSGYKTDEEGNNYIDVDIEGAVPTTRVTPFSVGSKRIYSQGIFGVMVAKNKDRLNKKIKEGDMNQTDSRGLSPATKEGIVDKRTASAFPDEVERVPMFRLVVPRDKDVFPPEQVLDGRVEYQTWLEQNDKKYTIEFVPYSDVDTRAAFLEKLGAKSRAAFEEEYGKIFGNMNENNKTSNFVGVPKGGF